MSGALPLWIRAKQATSCAVEAAGGQKVLAAVATRVTHSPRFSEYASLESLPIKVIPWDTAVEVDKYLLSIGKPAYHAQLAAAELGLLLVRVPQGRGPAQVLEASGRSAQEMGALMMELGQALSDGELSGPEQAVIHDRIRDLQVGLAELDLAVAAEGEVC